MASENKIYAIGDHALDNVVARVAGMGSGGHGGDDIGPRVAKLEADVGHIRDDVHALRRATESSASDISAIKVDLAGLKVKIDHLPSKGFILTSIVTGAGVVVAIITILSKLGVLAFNPTP